MQQGQDKIASWGGKPPILLAFPRKNSEQRLEAFSIIPNSTVWIHEALSTAKAHLVGYIAQHTERNVDLEMDGGSSSARRHVAA